MKIISVFFLGSFFVYSLASPGGAPPLACSTMIPQHGVEPQTTESPFRIVVSNSNVSGGDIIDVIIDSVTQNPFKGFLINAKTLEDEPKVVGEFLENDDETVPYNFVDCGGTRNSATHAGRDEKSKITLKWRAPENFEGSIQFHATVVQELVVFWINHRSQEITVTPSDEISGDDIYSECLRTKSCFGLPPDCIKEKNCTSFGAIIVRDGTYVFEMQSTRGAAFIAMALSKDNMMGDDSVIECTNEFGSVKAYSSLTITIPQQFGARRSVVDQSSISLVTSRIENGVIYCRVLRNQSVTIQGINYSMAEPHFLLMSSGSTGQQGISIGYHDINYASSTEQHLFTEIPVEITSKPREKTLLLLHGSFMIVAWIGLTAIGIFSARFMKKLWSGKQMFGKDVWFIVHTFSMIFTWILTIVAVILIWVDVGEFRLSTHSLLGIVAASLCFIQPISAFFRPTPDSESRPIFNFMHGSVGKLAQLLAVITIFFATTIDRANLPGWTKYVLISYVVVYLVFYAVLNNLAIVSDIKLRRKANALKDAEQIINRRPPLGTARRIFFIIFSLSVLGFAITLINAFVLNA